MDTLWTPDLTARDKGPRYKAIADALAADVAAGRLAPGTRLPTHRDLAEALGVTVGTVTRAYTEAERRGLVAATVGRGTFVAPRAPADTAPAEGLASDVCFPALSPRSLAESQETGDSEPESAAVIDLSANYPVGSLLAPALQTGLPGLNDFARLGTVAAYQPAPGHPDHRAAGAAWLTRFGLDVAAESVIVTNGCQNGLSVAFGALAGAGDPVLVESLAWPGIAGVARHQGLKPVAVEMDGEGLAPDALAEAARRHGARAVYCMPTLHNPTSRTMSRARREALLAVAAEHDLVLVEDDIYGFLRPEAPPPLAALDPERAIYVTSLSKSVAPGLRVGYLAAPPRLVPELAAVLRAQCIMAGSLAGEVASQLIAGGGADAAAAAQREAARHRQTLAAARLPAELYVSAPDSFHIWLRLPAGWSSAAFVRAALARGVGLTSGEAFTVDGRDPGGVRLCLCAVSRESRLVQALEIVAGLLAETPAPSMPVV